MNKNILKSLLSVAAVALMCLGCQSGYYNENYLDGYEKIDQITDVQTVELTLDADHYAAIAKNSDNKDIAQEDGEQTVAALNALSKNHYFATADHAAMFIPAYLNQLYPTYDDGSVALVTYTTAVDVPAEVIAMNAATEYTLSEADYQTIWESETEFVSALTPATINKLKNVLVPAEGMVAGDYVAVTYNYSASEPTTDEEQPGEGEGEEPATGYTSVLGTAALNDAVEVKGYISAVSTQGPILTDNGGSVLLYKTTDLAVGDEVTVTGTISSYNKGFQIGTAGITVEKTGTTTVTYPTAMEITGAVADELLTTRTEDGYAVYAKMTGVAAVSKYINFNIDGATTAQGSVYGATEEITALVTDGLACTLYGYFVSISSGKYLNMIVTDVVPTAATASTFAAPKVVSEKMYAYFKYNGTSFEATDIVAVQPSDFTAMGQKYGSFTNPQQDNYLPQFLAEKFPYAQVDDNAYVAYRCYANSATTWKVDHYTFSTEWNKVSYFENKTDQFRKAEGKWNIDRTLELNFPNGDAEAKKFYQYCVNWVYDNKDVALGAPARDNAGVIVATDIVTISGAKPTGDYWVSNYGNNEFYTGASAYYGNMDWRPSAVKGGFTAAGMGDLSDDQIVAKLKENTAEVFAAVLGYVYPTMTSDEFAKVVIKVYAYGPNKTYAFSFSVTGTGVFEYIADSITEL
jgi:hypothetical protein